jgi:hypothetical protein
MLIIGVILTVLFNSQISTAQSTNIPLKPQSVRIESMQKLDHPPVQQSSKVSVEPPALPLTELFDGTIQQWIMELAQQQEFKDWRSTSLHWERQPLGPGLHGWIVIISDHGQELGYLVVTVDLDGNYRLSEYGHGEYPLFSENTLYRSMIQHELIDTSTTSEQFWSNQHMTTERIYLSPLQSIWLVTLGDDSYQLDAKNGDLMSIDAPILDEALQREMVNPTWSALASDTYTLQQSLQLPAFDPYSDLDWIIKPPDKIKDLQQLRASLHQGDLLTFVTDLYNDTVVYAFSVTGYHQWNGGYPFISIDQDGSRYIPAQLMMQTGRYYSAIADPYSL